MDLVRNFNNKNPYHLTNDLNISILLITNILIGGAYEQSKKNSFHIVGMRCLWMLH